MPRIEGLVLLARGLKSYETYPQRLVTMDGKIKIGEKNENKSLCRATEALQTLQGNCTR